MGVRVGCRAPGGVMVATLDLRLKGCRFDLDLLPFRLQNNNLW